uniref:Uncharacterized protein n=1 Tax=Trypanosoma congolense (strain IL3000) TaxID=1068625 RepID=G0UJW3_TRYCI|nr:conserved hypothetical protein [Trypanosoma congolense IL3000]
MSTMARRAMCWCAPSRLPNCAGCCFVPRVPLARHICCLRPGTFNFAVSPLTAQLRLISAESKDGAVSLGQTEPPKSDGGDGRAESQQSALNDLLEEVQALLSRPVPIGSLFQALSAESKKTLVKNKLPLEQLLLQHPRHFALYQQGNVRNRTIYCAPAHLMPANARPMIIESSPFAPPAASGFGASTSTSPSGSGESCSRKVDDINARVLQHDPLLEKQQRINTVLQYIPNEWSPFADLGIPEEVRVKCMGKPAVKALQFFEKYPQYFEVRQQGRTEHTFQVRRSVALQRSQDFRDT